MLKAIIEEFDKVFESTLINISIVKSDSSKFRCSGTEVEITACADTAPGELTFTVSEAFSCDAIGGVEVVFSSGLVIPGVVGAGVGTTSVLVDFTTAATPAFLQAVECADFTFVGATLRCPFQ